MVTLIRIGVPWVIIGDERERPYNKRGACLLMRHREGFDDETTLHASNECSFLFLLFVSFRLARFFFFFFFTRRGVSIESTGKELKFGNILSS